MPAGGDRVKVFLTGFAVCYDDEVESLWPRAQFSGSHFHLCLIVRWKQFLQSCANVRASARAKAEQSAHFLCVLDAVALVMLRC